MFDMARHIKLTPRVVVPWNFTPSGGVKRRPESIDSFLCRSIEFPVDRGDGDFSKIEGVRSIGQLFDDCELYGYRRRTVYESIDPCHRFKSARCFCSSHSPVPFAKQPRVLPYVLCLCLTVVRWHSCSLFLLP